MRNTNEARVRRPAGRRWLAGAGALALALGAAACDTESLVELQDPDLITTPTVFEPENVDIVRNGALFEFARAMGGVANNNETPGYVGVSGYLSDEMVHVSSWGTFRQIDGRQMFDNNGQVQDVYHWMHRARNLAEQASDLYDVAAPADAAENQALLKALSGYIYVMFGEGFCGNVPFSSAPLGEQMVMAPGITTAATLDSAIVRFDQAIALAGAAGASADDYLALARLGKARALQNLGDLSAAAQVAAQVPADFVYAVQYSTGSSGQQNGFHWHNNLERRSSPWTSEGDSPYTVDYFQRGTPAVSADPRIAVDSAGIGGSTNLPWYVQLKYPALGSDIPLGTGTEARLIVAEADLNGGATAGSAAAGNWLAILNELRTDVGLGALTDPGAAEDRVRLLYEERALWMWLTGHRLGDMRRLVREYGYPANTVYPTGTTVWGVPYGTDVVMPVPEAERNNPEYNPGMCDLGEA